MPGSPAGYGYHWWAVPRTPAYVHGGFSAMGLYGQRIHVNPAERVVIAIQSAWPQSQDNDADVETIALIRAAVRALGAVPGVGPGAAPARMAARAGRGRRGECPRWGALRTFP